MKPFEEGMNKIADQLKEGTNTVLFDAELARLRGTGKAKSAVDSLGLSAKNRIKPVKDGFKQSIDNSIFDLEYKRLQGQQTAKKQFSNFLKDERAAAQLEPVVELGQKGRKAIVPEMNFKSRYGFGIMPFVQPNFDVTPSTSQKPFQMPEVAQGPYQIPFEDVSPFQSSILGPRQRQRPLQQQVAEPLPKQQLRNDVLEMPPLPPLFPNMPKKSKGPRPSEMFADFGRYNKKWKNPTLTGLDILGAPRRRK